MKFSTVTMPPFCGRCTNLWTSAHTVLVLWVIFSLLAFAIASSTLSHEDGRGIAILVFGIFGWAVRPGGTSMEYTCLAFLTLLTTSGAISWHQAWSGMASESVWLVFCGMAMSAALVEKNICEHGAALLCRGEPSWPSLVLRLHLVGALLAFTVPSQVVRCQLVLPIARGIISRRDIKPCSRTASAVMVSLVVSTNHCGESVLTGSVPNILAVGLLDRCDIAIPWGLWFLRMAPTFGAVTLAGNIAVVLLLVRAEQKATPRGGPQTLQVPEIDVPPPAVAPFTMSEMAVLGVFALALVLWATDLLHGIRPVTIGLVAVLLLYGPKFGPVPFDAIRRLNFPILILVAATMALVPLLSSTPTAGPAVRKAVRAMVLMVQGSAHRHAAVFLAAIPVMLLANSSIPAGILVPELCAGGGLDVAGIDARLGAMLVASMSNCCILPFQNVPFLIAMNLSRDMVCEKHFIAAMVINAAVAVFVVMPLTLAWWGVLGWST